MKPVKIPLSAAGIERAIRAVADHRDWLQKRSYELLERLAQEGLEIASTRFQRAVYDGDNDTRVSVEERGRSIRAVVAVGGAVLFIEFGTGVRYPDRHPEAPAHGMVRGGYGKGHGRQSAWGYYGDPGTNGQVKTKADGGSVVITRGNPANMPMYEAVKALQARLPVLVREVFR